MICFVRPLNKKRRRPSPLNTESRRHSVSSDSYFK
ncbi:hypothetical protein MGSAQ_002248 [marine sediment metagenome]|uniref:Uncharacterized protein n=1 Tax=marine sediment metagenome TaxID=412755 RepID=A0A1B6NS01_9ZZZZ